MSPDDFRNIEASLAIQLPEVYKQRMLPFPIAYLAGNAETDLWDNATALIERNLQLRADRHMPWPSHWLFIGDPVSPSGNAIDLRDPAAAVVWVDHCDLKTVDGQPGRPFEQWLAQWTTAIRSDLLGDGIDPDTPPPPPPEPTFPPWLGKSIPIAVVVVMLLAMIAGSFLAIRDMVRWLWGK